MKKSDNLAVVLSHLQEFKPATAELDDIPGASSLTEDERLIATGFLSAIKVDARNQFERLLRKVLELHSTQYVRKEFVDELYGEFIKVAHIKFKAERFTHSAPKTLEVKGPLDNFPRVNPE